MTGKKKKTQLRLKKVWLVFVGRKREIHQEINITIIQPGSRKGSNLSMEMLLKEIIKVREENKKFYAELIDSK